MSTRYTAVFTAKVVQVGTEEVQASSEKSVSENSPSLKQNHTEVVGGNHRVLRVQKTKLCLGTLHHFWSKSSPLAFVGILRFEVYYCVSVPSVPFKC